MAEERAKRLDEERRKVLLYNKDAMLSLEEKKEIERSKRQAQKKMVEHNNEEYQKKLAE